MTQNGIDHRFLESLSTCDVQCKLQTCSQATSQPSRKPWWTDPPIASWYAWQHMLFVLFMQLKFGPKLVLAAQADC